MPSASTTFTVGSPAQPPSIAPSVGGLINTNSNLNYPTYVPVTVPAPVPSKEAAITNVNMPQTVLPGSAFSIIVTVTTYIAGTATYKVNLQIPQLQLNQTSPDMQLSNNATGATTFNVSLPGTALGLTAAGVVTGQLQLLGGATGGTVDAVPLNFTIGGTAIRSPIGVVPAPIQNIPVGPVGVPVIGAVPVGPGAIRAYQGYRFGRGGGQRHQWDFMPHTITPQQRYAYQGVLGVDYTLACPDQSVANANGICADGVKAVVSPISKPPSALPPAPVVAPVPVAVTPSSAPVSVTPTVVPAPVAQAPAPSSPVITPTPTVTPAVITNVPTDISHPSAPTPTPPAFLGPPVQNPQITMPPFPTSNDPQAWQTWAQTFRQDLQQDIAKMRTANNYPFDHGRGWAWGNSRHQNWAQHRGGRHAYQTTIQQQPQSAVILTNMLPDGTLHLDVHGLTPMEPVTIDLNIPMSRISRTANLVADVTGHLSHDYHLTKPPNKQYIAALRVTGKSSNKVGFKSITV